jgi:hypothetical protein
MSSVIEFLEKLGSNAQLRHGSDEELATALDEAHVDAAASSAILAKDPSRLQELLGTEPMFIVQMPGPVIPGPEEEEEEDGEEDEEAPESRHVPAS